ncbi:MAG: hypothetical protein K2L75_08100, partial [Muribaculaceae bacterium]|nr:hypothetical protein [Muribaculaceae bacterium]
QRMCISGFAGIRFSVQGDTRSRRAAKQRDTQNQCLSLEIQYFHSGRKIETGCKGKYYILQSREKGNTSVNLPL